MKLAKPSLLHTTLLVALLLSAGGANAKIVCWKNNEGVRECGDAVPPEYAQKETRTINEQGRTTEVKERAKTAEELAAERAQQAEQEREAEQERQRKAEQDSYDRVLLATYLSEGDIERARERQIAAIDATIKITNDTIGKLQDKLNDVRKSAADYERKGQKIPERLQQDIDSLQSQLEDKHQFIASKDEEKAKLHAKYDAELARFRELKGITPGSR